MNRLKYLALPFMAAFACVSISCGGGDGQNDPYTPTPTPTPTPQPTIKGKHLTMTLDMPAEASENVITLKGLSDAVSRTSGGASWLIVTPLSYVSGAPQAKVAVTANLQSEARQQDVSFFAAADTLVLTVRQSGYKGGDGGVDNPYDIHTDQPAYAPSGQVNSTGVK